MILIIGASGHLGSAVTRQLLAQGKKVRLMTRNPEGLVHFQQQGAEVVPGDLRNFASLQRACQGIHQVVAAAHALNGKGDNNPQTVDDLGNRQLIDAAKEAGVSQLLFVSTQGAGLGAMLPFFQIKYQVEAYLRESGLPYTIIRPGAFMELWGPLIGEPVLKQGKGMVFGGGNNPVNFVSIEDVAKLVGMALDEPRASNRVIDAGGPENLTLNQVAAIFAQLRGQAVNVRHIPLSILRVMARLMRVFNPTLARLIQMSVYMDSQNMNFLTPETYQLFPIDQTRFADWADDHYSPKSKRISSKVAA